jgi:hypothetical protein
MRNLGSIATANLLPGGTVLLIGTFIAEVYDPLTGTFGVTGSPAETGLVGCSPECGEAETAHGLVRILLKHIEYVDTARALVLVNLKP